MLQNSMPRCLKWGENVRSDYEKEIEFSNDLSEFLDRATIEDQKRVALATVRTVHNSTTPNSGKNRRPDIAVHLDGNASVEMNWRALSNPFFIECKKTRYDILNDITQIYGYKYKRGSQKHGTMEKYGDYHVAVCCPEYLNEDFDLFDNGSSSSWLSNFALCRMLWHLGLGWFYFDKGAQSYVLAFNDQERITLVP